VINFVVAVVIGLVIGGIGGFVLRGRNPSAMWLAPVLAIVGAVLASVAATLFGDPSGDYGPKEIALQVVLAVAGVAVVAVLKKSPQPAA
jgi:uncharacterized membrane protein YeaQ/YmgE (transglycosylase-associated protein family)